jgi:hypothetical protein
MRPLIASALVAILAAACAAATPSPTVKPLATITITSPKAGETIAAGTVMVTYEVSDVVLVPAASAAKPEDYHLHVFLDLDTSPYIGKDLPVPAGDANPNPSRIIHTAAKSVTFNNVTAGEHTVTVFMTFASHVSVKPPVSATSKFTVR